MSPLFDAYDKSYGKTVQSSIDFAGVKHAFFLAAKAALIAEAVVARLHGVKRSALDVGCGVGALHPYLSNVFDRVHGTDISKASIAQARIDNPEVEYRHYEGSLLPYGDGEFDLVMTICVLHHVPVGQWIGFMHQLKRVTCRNGLVCVIEHNPFNPLTRLAVSRCAFDRDAVLLRSRRTEHLMREAGLREIETRFFLFTPIAARAIQAAERRLRKLPLGAQYMTCGKA